ncbi:MAG: DUF2059 domain-containing protein [Myxococcota bacterium]
MTRWIHWAAAVVLVAGPFVPAVAAAPTPSAHETKVRRLLELTGAGALGQQTMDGMLAQFASMPGLPPGFTEEFRAVAKPETLVDLVVPIYQRHLTEADVDAAITFYESPAGKRWTAAMPGIMAESMTAGQQWGTSVATEVMTRIQQKAATPPR